MGEVREVVTLRSNFMYDSKMSVASTGTELFSNSLLAHVEYCETPIIH